MGWASSSQVWSNFLLNLAVLHHLSSLIIESFLSLSRLRENIEKIVSKFNEWYEDPTGFIFRFIPLTYILIKLLSFYEPTATSMALVYFLICSTGLRHDFFIIFSHERTGVSKRKSLGYPSLAPIYFDL